MSNHISDQTVGTIPLQDDVARLEAASERLKRKREWNINLVDEGADGRLSSLISETFLDSPPGDSGEKHYKLIFILEFNSQYLLKPALAFLKQDGSFGHIESFSYKKLTEPVSREESRVLKNLLSNNREMAKLLFTIDLFAELNLTIFFENSRQPVAIKKCEKVKIDFVVNAIYKNDDITFFPKLALLDAEGNILEKQVTYMASDLIPGCFCAFNKQESILAYTLDDDLIGFLEFMTHTPLEYHSADIFKLKKSLTRQYAGKVLIHFNYKSVSIQPVEPNPYIVVSETKEMLCVKLFFCYKATSIDFESDEEYLPDTTAVDSNVLYLMSRAHEYEHAVHDMLTALFEANGENPFAYSYDDEGSNTDLLLALPPLDFLVKYGDTLLARGIEIKIENKTISRRKTKVAFHVDTKLDWFDVKACLVVSGVQGDEEIPLVIDPNLLKKGLVQLHDVYIKISEADLNLIQDLISAGMDTNSVLKVSKLNYSLINQIYNGTLDNEEEELLKSQATYEKLKDFTKIESRPVPSGFKGALRNYQQAGYNWLYFLHDYQLNGCLADDMGLGKTIQTLTLLQELKERDLLTTSLLILPVVTLSNWEAEIKQFTPNLSYYRHAGKRRTKNIEELLKYDLILVSYQTIKNDIELFSVYRFYYIILDEAQYIKNSASQVFKAIRSLKARHKLSLTGTPIENNTMDIWSQMNFLNPALFSSGKEFKQQFAGPIERRDDKKAVEQLRKLVFPFILRRKKEDVLTDLPDKEEIVYYCEMGAEQRDLYDQIKSYYRERLLETINRKGYVNSAIEIFDSMLKLRQLAIFPQLTNKEYNNIGSCKFDSLRRIIEEVIQEDHKILIFSQFVKSLQIIRRWCERNGLKYSFICGSTADRQEEIRKFQQENEVKIFLLSLKAGGVGINLTKADYVVLFDPWWNPAVEKQAIDRCYRMGQKRKVLAYRMIVKNSIEEKILTLQQRKKALIGELIAEETGIIKTLTERDVLSLFE